MSKGLNLILTLLISFFIVQPLTKAETLPYQLLYQKDGAAAGDVLGTSVSSAGDVDGDGRADFIIGAPFADPGGRTYAGSAYVYSGLDGSLLYQKDGAAAGDWLGFSVASAGDVNRDLSADFIIGANHASPGGLTYAGSAYLYSGATGNLRYQKNGVDFAGELGVSVASAGDVNADGYADFIIGAFAADSGGRTNAGWAYVYSGLTGSLLYEKYGAATFDELGVSVASAGDVNGDDKADFIIGALFADPGGRTDAGSAYVYSGLDGSLLYQKDGAAANDWLGNSVASAGDVNGDDTTDFIIGAPYADPGGSAYVYSGATGLLLYQKDGASGDNLGYSVASAGDVDGDGRADFIIGAPYADPGGLTDAGSAFVYSGTDGTLLAQIDGAAGLDYLGFSVASADDVNGDGRADFIIGAPYTFGAADAGSAYVYSYLNTVTGSSVVVTLSGGITLTFDSISAAGFTSVTVSNTGPPPANGFQVLPSGSPLYYDLTTTATFVDSVTTCFPYDPTGLTPSQEAQIQLQHYVSNVWLDVTTLLDTASNIVCGRANSFSVFALTAPISTDVPGGLGNRPHLFALSQNYPNPFNPNTTIRYYLPKREKVTLEIFNLLGERVRVLAEEEQTAREHTAVWDGKDENGKSLPSGIYFYRLKTEHFSETKKMIFLK